MLPVIIDDIDNTDETIDNDFNYWSLITYHILVPRMP